MIRPRKMEKLIVGVWLIFAESAFAVDAPPVFGQLYDTKSTSSISYRCKSNTKDEAGPIECEFNQITISNLQDIKRKMEDEDSFDERSYEKNCNRGWEELLHKNKQSSRLSFLKDKDWNELTKSVKNYCASVNRENYLNVIRIMREVNSRTCTMSSNYYKQSFNLVTDNEDDANVWVAKSGPDGPCGVILQSEFEPVRSGNDSKIIFWKYTYTKVVTNKQGYVPLTSCSDLEKREYIYDTIQNWYALDCDYINTMPHIWPRTWPKQLVR